MKNLTWILLTLLFGWASSCSSPPPPPPQTPAPEIPTTTTTTVATIRTTTTTIRPAPAPTTAAPAPTTTTNPPGRCIPCGVLSTSRAITFGVPGIVKPKFEFKVPDVFKNDQRIVNGQNTDISGFPWQALLRLNNGASICGGVILNTDWIMTAATCTQPYTIAQIEVLLGRAFSTIGGTSYTVKSKREHDQYVAGGRNYDVAVLELDRGIDFTTAGTSIKPICWEAFRTEIFLGLLSSNVPGAISGFGSEQSANGSPSTFLKAAAVLNQNATTCDATHNSQYTPVICAQAHPGFPHAGNICAGDVGGPLTVTVDIGTQNVTVLVGIASHVEVNGGVCQDLSYFTHVNQDIVDWARAITGNECQE